MQSDRAKGHLAYTCADVSGFVTGASISGGPEPFVTFATGRGDAASITGVEQAPPWRPGT